MRRRLRRQRRVREALLLDLGALVYELHRQGRRAPELLQEKAGELGAVDDEVRGLEEALGEAAGLERLLSTGIVGSCASCGALLNPDDQFCARCGQPARVRDGGPRGVGGEEPREIPGEEAPEAADEEPLGVGGEEPREIPGEQPPDAAEEEPPDVGGEEPPELAGVQPPDAPGEQPPELPGEQPPDAAEEEPAR